MADGVADPGTGATDVRPAGGIPAVGELPIAGELGVGGFDSVPDRLLVDPVRLEGAVAERLEEDDGGIVDVKDEALVLSGEPRPVGVEVPTLELPTVGGNGAPEKVGLGRTNLGIHGVSSR
jgi:hypothetical protein